MDTFPTWNLKVQCKSSLEVKVFEYHLSWSETQSPFAIKFKFDFAHSTGHQTAIHKMLES